MFPDWAAWFGLVLTAIAVAGIIPVAIRAYQDRWAPYYVEFKQLGRTGRTGPRVKVDIWNRTSSTAYFTVRTVLSEVGDWSIAREPPLWTVIRWPRRGTYRWQDGIPAGQHDTLRVELPYGFDDFDRFAVGVAEQAHPELLFQTTIESPADVDGPAIPVSNRRARAIAKAERAARNSSRRESRKQVTGSIPPSN